MQKIKRHLWLIFKCLLLSPNPKVGQLKQGRINSLHLFKSLSGQPEECQLHLQPNPVRMLDWTDALVMAPRVSRRTSSWARQPATLSMVYMGQARKDMKMIRHCSCCDCLFVMWDKTKIVSVPLTNHTVCMVQHIPSKGISRSGWGRGTERARPPTDCLVLLPVTKEGWRKK